MIELGVALRDRSTGQYSSGQPVPSPAAMQSAYGGKGVGALAPAAGAMPSEREILSAIGTAPQAKYKGGIGSVAKAETENIGRTVAMFLRRKAKF